MHFSCLCLLHAKLWFWRPYYLLAQNLGITIRTIRATTFSITLFDVSLFFLFQNIVILMLIFWGLSWLGDRFYKLKNHKATENVYECGFTSTHALRVSINFGFFIIALLLILYDVEFLFLIPVYFNIAALNICGALVYWSFIILVALSFVIDWETVSMKWIK